MREETPIFVREFSKDFAVRLSIEKKITKITARIQFMYSKLILKIIKSKQDNHRIKTKE